MSVKRKIFYLLPPAIRLIVRRLYYLPTDIIAGLSGKRHKYEPPKGMIFTGSGDFMKQGRHHLELLKKYINLLPDDTVLDIGCGLGRTAAALTTYVNASGNYHGFDVMEAGIKWCRKIEADFPNFNFKHIPLGNDLYNDKQSDTTAFNFPYNDNQFDKCYLFSVFTHMPVEEIAHYLKEIHRVLKPGGKCLATFFTYNELTEKHISQNNPFCFTVDRQHYKLMDKNVTSANIALKEDFLESIIKTSGLIKMSLINGFWNTNINKGAFIDFQDIVVMEKK